MEKILNYKGILSHTIIVSCVDKIENSITKMLTMANISTIAIEMCQNMQFYSKDSASLSREIESAGAISVEKRDDNEYSIIATNIVSIEDKQKLEIILTEIKSLDKVGIKKRFKELRRSSEKSHKQGAGIGTYLIAKLCDEIEYSFEKINEDKYYYTLNTKLSA